MMNNQQIGVQYRSIQSQYLFCEQFLIFNKYKFELLALKYKYSVQLIIPAVASNVMLVTVVLML